MKKGLLTIMIAALTILSTEAQNKFGYLNSNELLASMPESVAMQHTNLLVATIAARGVAARTYRLCE